MCWKVFWNETKTFRSPSATLMRFKFEYSSVRSIVGYLETQSRFVKSIVNQLNIIWISLNVCFHSSLIYFSSSIVYNATSSSFSLPIELFLFSPVSRLSKVYLIEKSDNRDNDFLFFNRVWYFWSFPWKHQRINSEYVFC